MKRMIECIYEKKKRMKRFIPKYLYWKKRLFKPFVSPRVFIIGCPEYSNLGDNAILLAMISYLKKNVGLEDKQIECITEHEFLNDFTILKKCISPKSLLLGFGGGNMGNRYRSEEVIRRTMLETFPINPTIIFPQTISYEGDTKEEDEQKSVKYYSGRKNLTIIAREKVSQERMKNLYPDTKILLTPDIVLSTTANDYDVYPRLRSGILFCTRSDGEKIVDDSVWNSLRDKVTSLGYSYKNTDMYSDTQIRINTRRDAVRKKMKELNSAELVITDRLHAMIFCAITSTPCIVFSNNNHKIAGTYDWISYLPYIRFVCTCEEAEKEIPGLLQMRDCKYDNKKLLHYFEALRKETIDRLNSCR